ncbi:MAG: STAS domain-containing protein, partial [Planctomycetota bacterium]|nr:STAS domain-containing protein [Planctomycetota bacterium]
NDPMGGGKPLEITVTRPSDQVEVVQPKGEVDMHSSPQLREVLKSATDKALEGIVLDLSQVDHMDSSGVAVLIEGLRWSRAKGIKYELADLSDAVRVVIELAKLDSVFNISPTISAAIEDLKKKT